METAIVPWRPPEEPDVNMENSIVPWTPADPTESEPDTDMETVIISPAAAPAPAPQPPPNQPVLMDDSLVSMANVSQILFHKSTTTQSFTVLSLSGEGSFQIRHADRTDNVEMTNALGMSDNPQFLIRDGETLKHVAGPAILEDARSKKLDTALRVPEGRTEQVIRQLKRLESENEPVELRHKAAKGKEVSRFKPIRIEILIDGGFQIAERQVNHLDYREKIEFYLSNHRGYVPLDIDGRELSTESCFYDVQKGMDATIYLAPPGTTIDL